MYRFGVVGDIMHLGKETFEGWTADKAPRLGAALSYYAVFSIGPMMIVAMAVVGFAFGEKAATGEIFNQLRGLLGDQGAAAIQLLTAGANRPFAGTLASAISAVTLLLGATGVVIELKDALNTIWAVEEKPGTGVRRFLMKYVVSVAAVIGIGFLLLVSLIISATIEAFSAFALGWLPASAGALRLLNFGVSFAILSLLFTLMFKLLPDIKLRFLDLLPGGILTAFLFSIGKLLISFYLGHVSFASSYGAAGSIIVLLAWTYYSAQIFFFGAEFTKAYIHWRHSRPEPVKKERGYPWGAPDHTPAPT